MIVIQIVLMLLLIIGAIIAVTTKDILTSVLALGFVSLLVSVFFLIMQAPDVALTEAAIGTGITTAIFIFAIKKTRGKV